MTLGPRILKTGLAVTVALYLCSAFHLEPAIFAAAAAIFTVQPSVYRTWKQMLDQVLTNTLGAVMALFSIYFLGDSPVIIGLIIMLVISLSLNLKMESTIPLTIVTVLAIMSAPGDEDFFFTLNRFLITLIGTGSAMVVNFLIMPPKYKEIYFASVQSTFQTMSLLLRTVISNELTERSSQEQGKKLHKEIERLEDQYKLFDEEREKIGKVNKINAREVVVFKQMLKTLQEGTQLFENIEEHYFQSKMLIDENTLFDNHLEKLIKCHEFLLLKYDGKVKGNGNGVTDILNNSGEFFEQILEIYNQNKQQKLRLMIIASSIVDYTHHLSRLNKLIDKYLN